MLNLPLSGIKKIEAIAQSSDEYISLSQGALRVGGIPNQIKEYLREILKTDKTDYYQSAWGIIPLRRKIASTLSKKHSTKISPDQILVTHGCIGALSTAFLTILNPCDEVIIPEPTYPAYEKLTKLARSKAVFVSCLKNNTEKSNDSFWELDVEKIKAATTNKTKIIVFSNPWNPLGITIPKETILDLIDWCEKNKIYLIVDEAYEDYSFDKNFESATTLVNKSEWVIKVASFSKNMAMSGWRVGYMLTTSNLCKTFGNIQDLLLNCPNIPAQYAAIYALDHPEIVQNFYNIIKSNLKLVTNMLEPLIKQEFFSYQNPNGGFYLFLKTQFQDSTDLCSSILNKTKVALIPGKFFGQSGASFLRLCYARDPEMLDDGISRILKFFG